MDHPVFMIPPLDMVTVLGRAAILLGLAQVPWITLHLPSFDKQKEQRR